MPSNNVDNKDTRTQILEAAERLFTTKGFEETSIAEIQREVQVARGTMYYYFSSKEQIMDEIIARKSEAILVQAREVASNDSLQAVEKFAAVLQALSVNNQDDEMLDHLHQPQNALMHEKINRIIIEEVTPILSGVVVEGIEEGAFASAYPYEAVEMLVVYANTVFDQDFAGVDKEVQQKRMEAFMYHASLMLGLKADSEVIDKLFRA